MAAWIASGRRGRRRACWLALLATVVVVGSLGLLSSLASADAPVVVTDEPSLDAALSSATSGETIQLGANITVASTTETVTVPTDVTLDLNG